VIQVTLAPGGPDWEEEEAQKPVASEKVVVGRSGSGWQGA
jgi:hypothetical protein